MARRFASTVPCGCRRAAPVDRTESGGALALYPPVEPSSGIPVARSQDEGASGEKSSFFAGFWLTCRRAPAYTVRLYRKEVVDEVASRLSAAFASAAAHVAVCRRVAGRGPHRRAGADDLPGCGRGARHHRLYGRRR